MWGETETYPFLERLQKNPENIYQTADHITVTPLKTTFLQQERTIQSCITNAKTNNSTK